MDKVDIGIIKTNIDKSQNTENQDFLAMMRSQYQTLMARKNNELK
jgi:hypothetical protein